MRCAFCGVRTPNEPRYVNLVLGRGCKGRHRRAIAMVLCDECSALVDKLSSDDVEKFIEAALKLFERIAEREWNEVALEILDSLPDHRLKLPWADEVRGGRRS